MERTVYVVEGGVPVEHRLVGACNECGQCCCEQDISYQVIVEPDTLDVRTWARLPEYEGWCFFSSQGLWWFWRICEITATREHRCKHYSDDGRCRIWNMEQFPAICRYWPVHPVAGGEFPDCGFRFERVEGNGH